MKRDMNLIRNILLKIEKNENESVMARDFPNLDPQFVNHNLGLVRQAGFALGAVCDGDGKIEYALDELTWNGHEFLDNIRNDTVWKKIKDKFGQDASGIPFTMVQAAATIFVKQQFNFPP